MLTLNDGRSELWQWDTGRTVSVDADCSQVHFSNKVFGRSIDVDVIDGVAIVPDILLQTDKDLNVWAFVGTAENGYTKISKTFKVNRRNKPADYVFTPTDQTTLDELVKRLGKIEESQDPDVIKNAVEDYLAQNPVEIPVQSVNGETGAVELTAEDVGALPNTTVIPVVPDALPNPSKLILTGAVEAEYDGSQEVTVEIPAGGSGGSGGGTDLGITGASVGQIAKITAVDDEGKPTAWEPVALAEAWEHICDISVSGKDEINAFTQEFDVPYKKLRIVRLANATAPTTGTSAGGQYWAVACDKDANNNNQTVVWMFDNDTWVTHIVECELLSPNVTWGKAYTSVYSKGFRGEYKTYGGIPKKGFSSIKIFANKLFNDGTFRIYGVRA